MEATPCRRVPCSNEDSWKNEIAARQKCHGALVFFTILVSGSRTHRLLRGNIRALVRVDWWNQHAFAAFVIDYPELPAIHGQRTDGGAIGGLWSNPLTLVVRETRDAPSAIVSWPLKFNFRHCLHRKTSKMTKV